MHAALRHFLVDVRERFPLLRVRHANYSFEDRCRSFANTAEVRRQEHRGVQRFWTMFGAKDAERSTSFNYTGASGHEPFERLMEAGAVERLIADTLGSFDPRPVPGKFTGDVIITPHCATGLAGTQDLPMNIRGVSSEPVDFGGGAFPWLAASGITISRP